MTEPALRFDKAADLERRREGSQYWWDQEGIGIDKLTAARQRLRTAFDAHDNVVVSFSGGKDSTVCLNLALELARELDRLPLPAIFLDEEALAVETLDYVRRVLATGEVDLTWLCIPVTHRNACSHDHPWWYPWAPEARDLWVRELPPEGIWIDALEGWSDPGPHPSGVRPTWPQLATWMLNKLPGRTATIMGIRASESLVRRGAISRPRIENYVIPVNSKIDKVYPIYDWLDAEVWVAARQEGWDHNYAYDLMEMAGVPKRDQRLAPPFGEEPSQSLWMWAKCYPDIWARLCDRVPGSAAGARYGRGQLFGAFELPAKPEGMRWEEFILLQIDRNHEDRDERIITAKRVIGHIRRHYKVTREPILEVPHPASGIAWPYLLKVAVRGDIKERKQAQVGYIKTQSGADRYYEALDEWRAHMPEVA